MRTPGMGPTHQLLQNSALEAVGARYGEGHDLTARTALPHTRGWSGDHIISTHCTACATCGLAGARPAQRDADWGAAC